jgi:hypothetical protein
MIADERAFLLWALLELGMKNSNFACSFARLPYIRFLEELQHEQS